ncbi:MAG: homoserine dehydrogenase [Lachnospiraceae bacterium]|nr:homoserine dehydrogenase [Lachnospiraceae bacterium]
MKAAVLGYGTVGGGVVEVLFKNKVAIASRVGEEIEVKYILDIRTFPGDPFEDKITNDFNRILEDEEVKIACETMGGLKPAYEFTKSLLEAGKSVCTSNKELVAAHGPELLKIAREHNCMYLFEASVGGGIPIIRPLLECLTAEKIDEITGILNGTTNYMLTKMDREGSDYADVLKEAQEKGYAERNPEADVEGYDACRKIAILASLNYRKTVNYEDIYTEGISAVDSKDFAYATELGKNIKLLGMCKENGEKKYAMVAPFMLDPENPLYSVNDVFNGILVHGNMVDKVMFYGRGAGKLPTASAVVSDVVEEARNIGKASGIEWSEEKVTLNDKNELVFSYFVRIGGTAETSSYKELFADAEVLVKDGIDGEFAIVTREMTEGDFLEKFVRLENAVKFIRIK